MLKSMIGQVSKAAGRGASAVSRIATEAKSKLSALQKDKKPNFEDIAIKNFNACLDDLETFKKAVIDRYEITDPIPQFSDIKKFILEILDNPRRYHLDLGRLYDEFLNSTLDPNQMRTSEIVLYGIANWFGITSTDYQIYHASIPEIDAIELTISNAVSQLNDLETHLSPEKNNDETSMRILLGKLIPLRIAYDKIQLASLKGNVPEDSKLNVSRLLDQYRQLNKESLSGDTSTLLTQLTEMVQRIEDHQTLVVSQVLKQLIVDVKAREEVKPKSRPKPPQHTSNSPIDWEREPIDVSNHSMPFQSAAADSELLTDGIGNQEPSTQPDTNQNSSWMIMACLIGGTVLIAACVALVVLSHGGAAPIGVAGIVVGANLISAAAGALGTLGLFGLGASYGLTMYSNDGAPRNTMNGLS